MKKTFVVVFVCIAFLSDAQENFKKRIAFSGNLFRVGCYQAQSFNIRLEFDLEEHWNVRYEFGFGRTNEGYTYYHFPATIHSGIKQIEAWISGDSDLGFLGGFIMLFLPEGVSYSLEMNEKLELRPFLDVNSREYFGVSPTDSLENKLSGDLGLSCQWALNPHLYVSAYASMTLLEGEGLGASGGIGIGWKMYRIYPKNEGFSPSPGF
ncbi:hypothetical protein SDC9_75730 [bioreactor metagenome]|uniref:Outer membrane protein beta-barrel domain-containing protein n=1 Tax=bioreactor metagenome TaxID=1076179 RepID=A0A644YLB5_9ZZZZ